MAILRRPRLLRCFYCNQRTSIAYDGVIRQFQCRGCDATNYLDQNGDITDPPASTTAAPETAATFYASPPDPFHDGLGSPGSGSAGSSAGSGGVFCATCLKNQHLFVSSLAQYFPSDPNDPDAPELERKYFFFRKGLEQRYPQICADCEPRVVARIRDADYTAKTDHLRRMVQYSRDVRLTRTTPLDVAGRAGRWLWWSGLVLQVLWQAGVLGGCLLAAAASDSDATGFGDDAIVDGDDAYSAAGHSTPAQQQPSALAAAAIPFAVQALLRVLAANAARLQSLCVAATVASCWWNPYLVETVRGFTRPLSGIPTWYAYQAAIVAVRVLLAKVAADGGDGLSASSARAPGLPPTIAGAHAVAALFAFYLYSVAPRAITKDMRPLFGKLPEVPVTPQKPARAAEQQAENRRRGLETLSDVLDEIATTPQRAYASPHSRRDSDTDGWDGWQPSQSSQRSQRSQRGGASWQAPNQYESPHVSTTPASQPAAYSYYGDEMDWTPTQTPSQTPSRPPPAAAPFTTPSPHRAFSTYSSGRSPPSQRPPSSAGAFSQTPVEASKGPFWYKVPPAPTSIAQRIFNRPNAPRIIDQSGFGAGAGAGAGAGGTSPLFNRSDEPALHLDTRARVGASSSSASVEFAQPSFFAEDLKRKVGSGKSHDDDPGSFLSDLFSQTFSLGQQNGGGADEADEDEQDGFAPPGSAHGAAGALAARGRRRSSVHQRRRDSLSRGQLVVQRLPALLLTVASLAGVALLHEGLQTYGDGDGDGSGSGSTDNVGSMDRLLFAHVRPYARLIEAAAVGLCAVLAAARTAESMQRWRRPATTPAAAVSSGIGLVLGVAGMALAGWMATQMWTLLPPPPPPSPPATEIYLSYDDYDYEDEPRQRDTEGIVLPWPWWQLASLHSAVLLHQVWSMLVQ